MADEKEVGKITHFFPKISVAVIEVTSGSLKKGDIVHIKGATTDFKQKIGSMQVDHESVEEAKQGAAIGMKVKEPVREHDLVYK